MLIVVGNEVFDLAPQIGHRVEGAAADGALRDQPEPAFDLVQPGGIGRGVVQVKARMTREPGFDSGMLVRAVVIDDQVHVEIPGNFALDVTQESEELLMSVARLALGNHLPLATSRAANKVVVP